MPRFYREDGNLMRLMSDDPLPQFDMPLHVYRAGQRWEPADWPGAWSDVFMNGTPFSLAEAAGYLRRIEWNEKGVELTQGEAVAILLRY
jgi:hypothetical protein